jgi:hypothetical protein
MRTGGARPPRASLATLRERRKRMFRFVRLASVGHVLPGGRGLEQPS